MHSTNGTKTPQNIKQHENSKEGNFLFSKLSTIRSNILPILSHATQIRQMPHYVIRQNLLMPQCALNVYLTLNKYVGGFPFTSKVTGLNSVWAH